MRILSHDVIFEGVDLGDSIVLSWSAASDALRISLEVSVLPTHPMARPARPGERACFLPGTLEFAGIQHLSGLLPLESVSPTRGSDGKRDDYDTVHCLQSDGARRYYLEGEFGEVYIDADPPTLDLSDSGWTVVGMHAVG